jgi:hypothetical protein
VVRRVYGPGAAWRLGGCQAVILIAEPQGSGVLTILLSLPCPVHAKKLFTRDGVVLAFMARLESVQPCELL